MRKHSIKYTHHNNGPSKSNKHTSLNLKLNSCIQFVDDQAVDGPAQQHFLLHAVVAIKEAVRKTSEAKFLAWELLSFHLIRCRSIEHIGLEFYNGFDGSSIFSRCLQLVTGGGMVASFQEGDALYDSFTEFQLGLDPQQFPGRNNWPSHEHVHRFPDNNTHNSRFLDNAAQEMQVAFQENLIQNFKARTIRFVMHTDDFNQPPNQPMNQAQATRFAEETFNANNNLSPGQGILLEMFRGLDS